VRLFDRTPRSVTLTEEGHRFYAQVVPLLASIEEVATDIAGTSAAVSGRLRVNVDPWFARMVLAPRLSRFMGKYPLLSVETGRAAGGAGGAVVSAPLRFGNGEERQPRLLSMRIG
jgi:DNA-binding transcriptional LysR family regulator